MIGDLNNRLYSALTEFVESAKEAGVIEGVPGMAPDYVRMGFTLRREPEYIQFEGHRKDRQDARDTWAYHARYERREAPWVLAILADEALRKVEPARTRLVQLIELCTYTRFSVAAADYLSRVAGLYIWGFDQELIPMSRSVLEAALEDLVEKAGGVEIAARMLNLPPDSSLGLANLIKVCGLRYLRLLSHEAQRRAFAIKRDTDTVLHELAPLSENHRNSLELIRNLTVILDEAFPEPFDNVGLPLTPIPDTQ